jgi:hypothetical protein
MKKTFALFAALAAALAVGALPAAAITDGVPDQDGHPYVGLMVEYDAAGNVLGRCSGALISPTVFVAAGHCTYGVAHAQVWFDPGYPTPIPLGTGFDPTAVPLTCNGVSGFPCTGGAMGTPYAYPDFDPSAFPLHDVGVVVLDHRVDLPGGYGALPGVDQLDALKPSAHTTFTAVGYGAQASFPPAAAWKNLAVRTRMVAHPQLLQIDTPSTGPQSLIVSDNAHTGGTCFGDSGGPYLLGDSDTIAGVTSFGKQTCSGNAGVFRLDRADVLAWLTGFLPS